PRRTGHDGEDLADGVQGGDAFRETGAAGVPYADDGHVVGQGSLIGTQDDLAALDAHRPTLDGRVRTERNGGGAVRCADGRQDTGVVLVADELHRAGVEERREPGAGVAGVVGLRHRGPAGRRGGRRGLVGLAGHQMLLMTRATLWPPKPKLLFRAAISPEGSERCAPWTTSRAIWASRSSTLIVAGAVRSWIARTVRI